MLPRIAASQPDATAIYFPSKRRDAQGQLEYVQVSYRELDARSDRIAAGLHAIGIVRGERAALMVKPSPELFALTFAMFKAGVVPVMIDPGLGLRGLASCLANAKPSAFIGIPLAHAARIALGWGRESIERLIWVGGWYSGLGSQGRTLAQVEALGAARLRAGEPLHSIVGATGPDEIAAVLFTSGSTGPSKGVIYRHRTFVAQVEAIRSMFGIEPGEVDLPTFPLFALFDPALGMTTVLPDMDALWCDHDVRLAGAARHGRSLRRARSREAAQLAAGDRGRGSAAGPDDQALARDVGRGRRSVPTLRRDRVAAGRVHARA
jgi:acyl-CoA synthetase (AMP-forming)/AMP-acid ligase II